MANPEKDVFGKDFIFLGFSVFRAALVLYPYIVYLL